MAVFSILHAPRVDASRTFNLVWQQSAETRDGQGGLVRVGDMLCRLPREASVAPADFTPGVSEGCGDPWPDRCCYAIHHQHERKQMERAVRFELATARSAECPLIAIADISAVGEWRLPPDSVDFVPCNKL